MPKWQIIFYNHLHPKEARCLAETQLTNKRICFFKKHNRYNRYTVPVTLYHEIIHIIFYSVFHNKPLNDYCDKVLDLFDYRLHKLIHKRNIVKVKGWHYYKTSVHPWTLKSRWNSDA